MYAAGWETTECRVTRVVPRRDLYVIDSFDIMDVADEPWPSVPTRCPCCDCVNPTNVPPRTRINRVSSVVYFASMADDPAARPVACFGAHRYWEWVRHLNGMPWYMACAGCRSPLYLVFEDVEYTDIDGRPRLLRNQARLSMSADGTADR